MTSPIRTPLKKKCQSAADCTATRKELSQSRDDALEGAVEINRLRDGLRWYADGHHYDLENWEDCSGESANWLFPPTDDGWMIDNGGIARAILDYGHSINPNHKEDDNITIEPDAALKGKPAPIGDAVDTVRLDALQAMTKGYGRGWILRNSSTGRGMRLHETSMPEAKPTVREAIDAAIRKGER